MPARESTPVTFQMELHFDADMASFAKDYFHNKSYLRIGGRPVVFLYLTRTLTGDVAGMIQGARTVLKRLGYNPYFIGDEVYWRVTPRTPIRPGRCSPRRHRSTALSSSTPLRPTSCTTGIPTGCSVRRRISRATRARRTSSPTSAICSTSTAAATDGRVPVVPDIASGFNDRGFRLPTNHPAQPRQWLPGVGPASTLDHLFRRSRSRRSSPPCPW